MSDAAPWYKHFWLWFIIALLGYSVIQGLTLLTVSIKTADSLVVSNYYDVGKGINQSLDRERLAQQLNLHGQLQLDAQAGIATLQLQGDSLPAQLQLNLISPTQPERDRQLVLQHAGNGSYRGHLEDAVSGRRFIELLGQQDQRQWRLFEEETLVPGQAVTLGDER